MSSKTVYSRERKGYRLEIIEDTVGDSVLYDALLTNITTGATQLSPGWRHQDVALEVVKEMFDKPRI